MGASAGVTELDRRAIGDGPVGPTTQRLSDLYRRETATWDCALWDGEAPSG